MAFGAEPTDSLGVPISSVYVPGTGFIALKGSTNTNTDASSNPSTAATMAGDYTETASLSAGALNADLVASVDVSFFKWFSVQVTGTWVGTLTFQGSNDNSNFVSVSAFAVGTPGTVVSTATANGMYVGPVTFRYLRVRMTSYTSGTANGTLEAYTFSVSGFGGGGSSSNASVGSTGSAVPASAGYMGGNKAGNLTGLTLDGSGNLNVNVAAGGASGGTSSSFGSAVPATGTAAGFSDGTNMQAARVFDADTGAGTQYVEGVNLRISASGGSIEAKGQQAMASSMPVVIASDQSAVPASQSGSNWTINNVQVNGTTIDTNSGVKSAGTQRVVLATDQPQLTNALKVDGSAVTQPVSGTVSITANSAVNVAQVAGTTTDTNSGNKSAGTQRVVLATDQPSLTNAIPVSESGTWTVGANSATGSAVPANAFYGSGIAKTALPSAATDGNLTGEMVDKFGRQVVVVETVRDLRNNIPGLTLTSTTETTLIAAVASTFNDITGIICENTSATAVRVDFRDSTAGTIQFSLYVPAGDTRGFSGLTFKQGTVNTAWTAQLSSAVTDVRIYGTYVANK